MARRPIWLLDVGAGGFRRFATCPLVVRATHLVLRATNWVGSCRAPWMSTVGDGCGGMGAGWSGLTALRLRIAGRHVALRAPSPERVPRASSRAPVQPGCERCRSRESKVQGRFQKVFPGGCGGRAEAGSAESLDTLFKIPWTPWSQVRSLDPLTVKASF